MKLLRLNGEAAELIVLFLAAVWGSPEEEPPYPPLPSPPNALKTSFPFLYSATG